MIKFNSTNCNFAIIYSQMALNIDLDGFGFLESDSDASKLSPTLNKQPPISPIESESSSGISSLDSDDLKVSNVNSILLLLF